MAHLYQIRANTDTYIYIYEANKDVEGRAGLSSKVLLENPLAKLSWKPILENYLDKLSWQILVGKLLGKQYGGIIL